MQKNIKKKVAMIMCSLLVSVTGCGKTEPTAENTTPGVQAPTEAPATITEGAVSEQPLETPTVAPTPTAIPTPTAVPVQMIADVLGELQAAGVVAEHPEEVPALAASKDSVRIESVQTFDNAFVVVTLDAGMLSMDAGDIVLKKYTDDWYSLSADSWEMEVAESYVTRNEEGKTVIIYRILDLIEGTKAVTDTSERKSFNLKLDIKIADNYLSWQMEHGGWDKKVESQKVRAWDGVEKKNKFSTWTAENGEMAGTIDNEATYTQMRHIAAVYREVPEEKYKESVKKGLDFIFLLQEESGAFAQCYPRRGGYSDAATFNDNAMINVLIMLEDMRDRVYPFDSDIIPEEYMPRIEEAIDKGVDFILKSQIVSNGKLTAWCAQHDPVTYEPVGARSYELPSISGSESVAIVKFLMNQEQTPEIKTAVEAAIQWFKESEAKGIKYVGNPVNGEYFIEDENSSVWYRFYEIDTNRPIFCDRDGIKKYNIAEIGDERRTGYSWSGTYPQKLLKIYDTYGYYAGRIEAVVGNTASVTADNKTLTKDEVQVVETEIKMK
ncbi:MAG: pectate lyase [Lachnospiraceae bacterium]|nr:pectate lyase [Lachnospiraceae bacterium]